LWSNPRDTPARIIAIAVTGFIPHQCVWRVVKGEMSRNQTQRTELLARTTATKESFENPFKAETIRGFVGIVMV
jgi:hypothetical protein